MKLLFIEYIIDNIVILSITLPKMYTNGPNQNTYMTYPSINEQMDLVNTVPVYTIDPPPYPNGNNALIYTVEQSNSNSNYPTMNYLNNTDSLIQMPENNQHLFVSNLGNNENARTTLISDDNLNNDSRYSDRIYICTALFLFFLVCVGGIWAITNIK